MVKEKFLLLILISGLLICPAVFAQELGGLRGLVRDKDFDSPLAQVQVLIAESGQRTLTTEEGNFVFAEVEAGTYTIVISKDGYTRQVKADVVVTPGTMKDMNISLSGEFTEMEEFIVQDLQFGGGSEAALLELRMESPALMDSISSDLMSQAGATDAASALKLVSGATVQDGKYAVVRGLPDRYVNSQMNGVRLPTADADKRAVQLDQFPSAIIESVQVTKTFTPDQQGDASGGAVNIVLKGIPNENILKFNTSLSWNKNVRGGDFLSYKGGGLDYFSVEDRGDASDIKGNHSLADRDVAAGVSDGDAPLSHKWSIAGGGKKDYEDFTVGGFGSFFYERDSSHFEDGVNDKYWVGGLSGEMEPQTSPDVSKKQDPTSQEFTTSLFDVKQSSEQVQWGGLGVVGIENEDHSLNLLYLRTHTAEETVTLAEDTRGKEYYFPGYDRNDPTGPGNSGDTRYAAPYIRTETIEYTERTTQTLQLSGKHNLFDPDIEIEGLMSFLKPQLDWVVASSSATLYQPDKRQFGSVWYAESYDPGFPPWVPPGSMPAEYDQLQAGSNISFGNYQRIWKDISEDSDQYSVNLKIPFEQWTGDEGYFKFGIFKDKVARKYEQESLSNSGEGVDNYQGDWDGDSWSENFNESNPDDLPGQPRIDTDVDYDGDQDISAWYYMADIPLNHEFNVIGGFRFEDTDLSITNHPDSYRDVTWIGMDDDGNPVEVSMTPQNKGDVAFDQSDVLPSIGFVYEPSEQISFRGSYSETIARQTFKELSPILQQEYLGGDIFIGNPDLRMSALDNYDLRFDWRPFEDSLVSVSYFHKDVTDPIEYVRRVAPTGGYAYTTPVNYPEGKLDGFELEVRQQIGRFWDKAEGLSLGANATFIDSEVELSQTDYDLIPDGHKFKTRDMVNTPEHLYNFFATYDIERTGTKLGLFYTIRGDTLVAGAGQSNGNFIPNIYETEYGTLNFSLSQKINDIWDFRFQAKNLLDPDIETVYRDNDDTVTESYSKGMEFSISFSATF